MTDSSTERPDPETNTDDDLLPEDLRPSEDNPLAEPLSEAETPDDPDELDMRGGKDSAEADDTGDDTGEDD